MNLDTSPGPCLLANRDEISEPASSDNAHISAVIINEDKKKDKRKPNMILHNLPESDESDPTLRKTCNISETTISYY